MKLVDELTTILRDWDLRYVFGVSGANIEHLHDSIYRLGQGRLESVLAKSESGASFMADCRARVHKTLGVCCATSGGGMMNLAVGVAESFADGVPVLAIVGQPPRNLEGRGAFQDSSGSPGTVDGVRLWSSISKFCVKITDPSEFWPAVRQAVRTAMSGRPGPSVLLIPRDLYDQPVDARPDDLDRPLVECVQPTLAANRDIERLYEQVMAAEAPVLLFGAGLERSHRSRAAIEFARSAGIPVCTTLSSKGAFPNLDPLYLGMIGVAGEPSAHRYLAEEADLLVAVGSWLEVMTRHPIAASLEKISLAVVGIDVDQNLWPKAPDVLVPGDAGHVFEEMLEMSRTRTFRQRKPIERPVERYVPRLAAPIRTRSRHAVADSNEPDDQPFRAPHSLASVAVAENELLQSTAVEILQSYLPSRGHLLFDGGNCAAAGLHALRIPANVTATIALGMGGMGYAIAGAVGAQLGSATGSRTVVLCGDGAYLMQGMEIHTAIEYRLPILYVVFNNGMHGMCVTRQQLYFEGRIECSQYPPFSAAGVARGLDPEAVLWTRTVTSPFELTDALHEYDQAFSEGPGVLELMLGREEIPPFTPFLPNDAETYRVGESRKTESGPTIWHS
jgi:acetolactate synthase-1/2/3 large subunit